MAHDRRAAGSKERPTPDDAPAGGVVRGVRIVRGAHDSALPLVAGERYVVGRHDAADIAFADDDVSRLHGVIRAGDGGWLYEDYGSANGSELVRDDVVVPLAAHAPVALHVGDIVHLGGVHARLELLADVVVPGPALGSESSKAARAFAERLRLAARTRVPVFLLGASGVGKTHSARVLHELARPSGRFVPINCARLPQDPSSLHSELLGHTKGAFTGADAARTGRLLLADGGTLFLDEVESLPPLAQGFLLDVLEGSGDLAPLGSGAQRLQPPTFRLISASKRPLVDSGLRADLCERLAEGHLWHVPGLQERRDDIPGLLRRFAAEQASALGVDVQLAPAFVRLATDTTWPGQIRQLKACVTVLCQLLLARHLERDDDAGSMRAAPASITLREHDLVAHLQERALAFGARTTAATTAAPADDDAIPVRADARRLSAHQLRDALRDAGGSQAKAARTLGIARNTLARKLKEFGIDVG